MWISHQLPNTQTSFETGWHLAIVVTFLNSHSASVLKNGIRLKHYIFPNLPLIFNVQREDDIFRKLCYENWSKGKIISENNKTNIMRSRVLEVEILGSQWLC